MKTCCNCKQDFFSHDTEQNACFACVAENEIISQLDNPESYFATLTPSFSGKGYMRSAFFNDIDTALEYADQYMGVAAIENLTFKNIPYKRNSQGDFELNYL